MFSVMMKPASGQCNMKCDYCFYCDEACKRNVESYGFMSEETLKNIIRRTLLRTNDGISYAFQGGEPTLRGLDFFKALIEYEKKYNKNHVKIDHALQTNGLLLDDNWCAFLKENNFLVGLSVDGTGDIHDSLRHTKNGKNTYERVIAAAETMDKYGVDYNILTVVTNKTAEHIEEIYSLYKERGWKYQQYIACLDPLGEEHGKNPYAIRPESYGEFLIKLFELWYKDLLIGEQPFIRQFENWVGIAMGRRAESCDMNGCCGLQYVVEADGSVFPCDFYMLDDYCLGNFNTDRIDAIDEKRRQIGFIERSFRLSQYCKQCKYARICRGGCQRNRDFDALDESYKNYLCEGYKMFFDKCAERIYEIANELSALYEERR